MARKLIAPGQYRNELLNGKGLKAVVRELGCFQGQRAIRLALGEFDTDEQLWSGLTIDEAFAVAVACGADETLIGLATVETIRSVTERKEQQRALSVLEQGISGFGSASIDVLDEAILLVRASGFAEALVDGNPKDRTGATEKNSTNLAWYAIHGEVHDVPGQLAGLPTLDASSRFNSVHDADWVRNA